MMPTCKGQAQSCGNHISWTRQRLVEGTPKLAGAYSKHCHNRTYGRVPFSELMYVVSLILQKMRIATRTSLYTPDFKSL
ncbi:hypothetical protein NC653_024309 [Populus alba x Populus x berolinensis]|uniref:Uncharacterized protein n=1 Tax=Populus alba x Populus x berolinensis TaxID=444605 RepID=A0AAD6M8E5_9ROSI|nr:hypothetical protein NC653_024309 [Populus alba x Populus x berolinensis]